MSNGFDFEGHKAAESNIVQLPWLNDAPLQKQYLPLFEDRRSVDRKVRRTARHKRIKSKRSAETFASNQDAKFHYPVPNTVLHDVNGPPLPIPEGATTTVQLLLDDRYRQKGLTIENLVLHAEGTLDDRGKRFIVILAQFTVV